MIADVFRLTDTLPLSVLVWAGHMIVFHAVGAAFSWCDSTGKLRRFKVRRRERLSYGRVLPRVLFNQTFVLLPAMWLSQKAGLAFVGSTRISFGYALGAILLMTIGHDVVQYAAHRGILHNPHFRRLGHALHHSTGASCGISACYMSVPDFLLTIVCPYLVPLILIGGGTANPEFQLLVASVGAIGGLYEHSGYDFAVGRNAAGGSCRKPLLKRLSGALLSSHAHGEHHRRYGVSFSDGFGSPGLCDTIFRTRWDLR